MNKDFKWLHLSDLHIKPESEETTDKKRARWELLRFIETEKNNIAGSYVFITGDIAHEGDYSGTKEFFEKLFDALDYADIQKSKVYWAVGDHDIRSNSLKWRRMVIDEIRNNGNDRFKKAMDNEEERSLLLDKGMCDYHKTNKALFDRENNEEALECGHAVYPLDELNLVVLNTCLTSCGGYDTANLHVASNWDNLASLINRDKPVIVLGHHGSEFFTQYEKNELELFFSMMNVDIYLYGHNHKLSYDVITRNQFHYIHQIACGSLTCESVGFSFTIGEYVSNCHSITVTPYKYNKNFGWKADHDLHQWFRKGNTFPLDRLILHEKTKGVGFRHALDQTFKESERTMAGIRPILLVTANKNETNALLQDNEYFKHSQGNRSSLPEDTLFYNIGYFGKYYVVHFELPEQGAERADASLPSIETAIRAYNPVAVILVGIAFGKDDEDKEGEERQRIGDVLISTRVTDYESGKVKAGKVEPDGSTPDAGRHLLSAFKYKVDSWQNIIDGRPAKYEFGQLLSGDKVVDDKEFKHRLLTLYPRAIGGEMEGRGAYSACRRHNLNEWIVVKAICDFADGYKGKDKQGRQLTAARSAVSLLKHVLSDEKVLDKIFVNKDTTEITSNK